MNSNKDVKISGIQLGFLIFGFLYGSTAILNPVSGAGRDTWLAIIFGTVLGLVLLLMYTKISLLNPGQTLVEILCSNFGRVIGSVISILYIWYFTHLAALVTRNFGEFMATTSYPETPSVVIVALFAGIVAYSVRSGLDVIGRISEVIVPIIPAIVLTVCLALITVHDFSTFKPILENGFAPVLKSAFDLSTFPFGEACAFMMAFPYINKKESLRKAVISGAVAAGLIFLLAASRDAVILGPDLFKNINYAPDITTKLIPGISIEPFVDVNLLIGGGIKTAICLYAATKATAQLLKLENYKPIVNAFAAFAVVLCLWLYTNSLEMVKWAKDIWPIYSIPFQYVIPAILLVISWIKSKRSKKACGS